MNRSPAIFFVLALFSIAGCATPQEEEEVSVSGDSALETIADEPAEVPAGAKPKVETIDLSSIKFDLSSIRDSRGNPDYSRLKIDVLDTGFNDHDYMTHSRDLKWVESDRRELPAFVDKIANGVEIGGGKCRIKDLSLKKVVVGCKWTW